MLMILAQKLPQLKLTSLAQFTIYFSSKLVNVFFEGAISLKTLKYNMALRYIIPKLNEN